VTAKNLAALECRLGHEFTRPEWLREALTHSSVSPSAGQNNQRLEFLGDRVLALVISDFLFQEYPLAAEGALALRLNALVRRETCASVAMEIGLGDFLILSASEAASGGREKHAILGDACEAVIGALYLDGGMAAARQFVRQYWIPRQETLVPPVADAKTALQEWSQARQLGTPDYRVTGREGPDHAPLFRVEASLPGYAPAIASGPSKRDAERAAAALLLRQIGVDPSEPEKS
jgi:ribonuclease III